MLIKSTFPSIFTRQSPLVNLGVTLLLGCWPSMLLASDKLLVNANVWTGNVAQPWAQVVVIRDNRILAVGGAEIARKYQNADRIDAKGRLVLPGFIDNHTHFMDGSASLVSIATQSATTVQQFVETVAAYSKTLAPGQWITGGLWDHEAWGGELPQKQWIDQYTRDIPLMLYRIDGHMVLANSRALELAGVDRDSPDPLGGVIVRDASGEPTGVLKDTAIALVQNIIPADTQSKIDTMFDAGVDEALRNGVTQIHNMSNWQNIAIFERAKADGRLKIRTYYLPHISHRQALAARIAREGKGDNWLRFGGVKELVDGSLGSTTAWFYQPYADQPETSGFPLMTLESLKTSLTEAHALGLQLAIHGIGDKANDELLNLFAELDVKGHRARIEHAQHLSDEAVTRMATLEVVASMQPYHAIDDGRWAEKRIGHQRLAGTYAFKSLLDAGARVSFGSDWSVAPLNPISGIYAAVTRRTLDGKNPKGWVPAQKISVEQAVRAYTMTNAWAGFQEDELGTIAVGKLADLVMLSDNIFDIPAEQILQTRVVMTVVDGEILYQEN